MLRLLVLLSISSAFLSAPDVRAQNAAPSASKSTEQIAQDFAKIHEAWGPKASTPGATLVIKESMHSGPVFKYRLIAGGVPKGGGYSIVAWPITQMRPSQLLTGVRLDPSGLAICAGTPGTCGSADNPNDPIDLVFKPAPGEPVRLGLVSADGATKVFASLVPVPLRGEDRGCSAEAILLTPGAEAVLIVGSGFPSNADLTMDADSEGERHSGKAKADTDGRYLAGMVPYVLNVAGGTTTVNLTAANCSPRVSFPWGHRK